MKCLTRLLRQTDDSAQVLFEKKLMFFFSTAIILINGTTMIGGTSTDFSTYVGVPGLTVSISQMGQLLFEKRLRYGVVEIFLYGVLTDILLFDYVSLTHGGSLLWSAIVVLLDVSLLMKLKPRVARSIIVITILWFLTTAFESTIRLGFYDFSFLPSQEERKMVLCECDTLPCPTPLLEAITTFLGQLAIFLLDFYFTRGFASRLYKEHEKMENVILAAENIAETLSRFDLKKAREALDTSPLPPPLHNAFSNILSNLHVYRPYIPDAVFAELQHSGELLREVLPPGLEIKKAAVVFTDIQGSTATWEACPEGMREGLKVHNNVMRECLSEHNGYEVKTIGDSFMVAFRYPSDAVSFSLSVQEELVNSIWPQELLNLDHCAWNEDGPWCGLRVRIGVHFGEVDVQLNTLTGRYDYFGNTVNKAARMEGACVGGAVAVTEEVMEKIGEFVFRVVVIPMGEVRLRGVSDPLHPFILLPDTLSGRAPFIESQLLLSRDDRRLVLPEQRSLNPLTDAGQQFILTPSSSASVGLLDMRLPDECNAAETSQLINETLAKVMMCTERSHGVLISVQGSRAAVGWNTSRPCPTHIENSLSFVVTLQRVTAGQMAKLHIGLSNSEVKHGTVGREQKFVTVLGRCVDVAGSLCSLGVKDDVFCLYGSVAEELCAMDSFRFVPYLEIPPTTAIGLRVYEARVRAYGSLVAG